MTINRMRAYGFIGMAVLGAALVASVAVAPAAGADASCETGGSCDDSVSGVKRDLVQQGLDRALGFAPDADQVSGRLGRRGVVTSVSGAVPLTIAPTDNTVTLRATTSDWSAYLQRLDNEKIEALKPLAPEGLDLSAPKARAKPKLEIWSNSKFNGLKSDATREGYAGQLGADYILNSNVLLGAMVAVNDTQQQADAWNGASAAGTSYLFGPYLTTRLGSNLELQALAGWGESFDTISSGDDGFNSGLAGEYGLLRARLGGNWQMQDWQFAPGVAVAYAAEMGGNAAGEDAAKTTVTAGPELRKTLRFGDGQVVQPFVNYTTSLDIDTLDGATDLEGFGLDGKLGTGVVLSKQNEYTIRASTEFDGIGTANSDPTISSRVQVNVPLH